MPTSVGKMMGHMTSAYTDQYREDYVDARTTPHPTNLARFFQALYDGYWKKTTTDIAAIRTQMHLSTMTGANLDKWARIVALPRKANEDDASYRIRIYGAIRRLFGGVTPDAIIEFVEAVLGAEPGSVTIQENTDETGAYRAGFYSITFNLDTLLALGFREDEFTGVIETIDAVLQQVSAAGVRGVIATAGGAVWDTDPYDVAGEVWGG